MSAAALPYTPAEAGETVAADLAGTDMRAAAAAAAVGYAAAYSVHAEACSAHAAAVGCTSPAVAYTSNHS